MVLLASVQAILLVQKLWLLCLAPPAFSHPSQALALAKLSWHRAGFQGIHDHVHGSERLSALTQPLLLWGRRALWHKWHAVAQGTWIVPLNCLAGCNSPGAPRSTGTSFDTRDPLIWSMWAWGWRELIGGLDAHTTDTLPLTYGLLWPIACMINFAQVTKTSFHFSRHFSTVLAKQQA